MIIFQIERFCLWNYFLSTISHECFFLSLSLLPSSLSLPFSLPLCSHPLSLFSLTFFFFLSPPRLPSFIVLFDFIKRFMIIIITYVHALKFKGIKQGTVKNLPVSSHLLPPPGATTGSSFQVSCTSIFCKWCHTLLAVLPVGVCGSSSPLDGGCG